MAELGPAVSDRHVEGVHDQGTVLACVDGPADDAPAERVHHRRAAQLSGLPDLRHAAAHKNHDQLNQAIEAATASRDDIYPSDPNDPESSTGPSPTLRKVGGLKESVLVDLWGRLSNPRRVVETLAEQGSQAPRRLRKAVDGPRNRASDSSSRAAREQEGRLSNPVQRRLSEAAIDDLVSAYLAGSPIDALAAKLGVNRTTIISHLERCGIDRRRSVRKMTDRMVDEAAVHYESGESLKTVAARFGVDARTLAREFRRSGHPTRVRNGWPVRR